MEQRLIDANALIKAICSNCALFLDKTCDGKRISCYPISIVLEQPTVDAVPVVRCRDCKWFKSGIDINGKPFTKCIGANGSVRTYGHTAPDWFCADGERRSE